MKPLSHLQPFIGCTKISNIFPVAAIRTHSPRQDQTVSNTRIFFGRNLPMMLVLVITMFLALVTLPASAQIQYFGYVGGADDDQALGQTKGFTNFAHLSAGVDVRDPFIKNRVSAMAPLGVKAVIDLGKVLWCDYDSSNRYLWICGDWAQRWKDWKDFNITILTPDKVIAFAIRDEPFNYNVNMNDFEQAAARVKSDLPWVKLLMTEAACVVARDDCGFFPGSAAVSRYGGTLPNIDWIGLDVYQIWPKTDTTFQYARDIFRLKFPGKKWSYVMDGYWDPPNHMPVFGNETTMRQVASDWYEVARADPNAVLLGVFFWYGGGGIEGSQNFPCYTLSEHVRIGRAITGKVRAQSSLPVGQLDSITNGGLGTGWACDPDGTLCENPPLDLYVNGSLSGFTPQYSSEFVARPQCGTGTAYRFHLNLVAWTSGYPITVKARDLDTGSVTLPSSCAENPACIWYSAAFDPKGYMEAISPTGIASGWVCDPDAPQVSSKVRLAFDGSQIGIFTTNLANEQAVADECRGGFLHRFSVQLPTVAGCHKVYAWAEDLTDPWNEKLIPWLCPDGWFCQVCNAPPN
jgi:hypothetical protein